MSAAHLMERFHHERVIQFRAWTGEVMTDDFYVNHLGKPSWWNPIAGHLVDENWPLLQFTGLRDKNAVDIYEGDIVEDKDGLLHKVYFNQEQAQFGFDDLGRTPDDYVGPGLYPGSLLVIGNIYEHPELLNLKDSQFGKGKGNWPRVDEDGFVEDPDSEAA